jgi:hypothetical protein
MKCYFALVAQVNNSPEWGPVLMTRHFDPLVDKFIAVLCEALPDCPPREIYWGYQFLTGALTLTFAETGRIDKLSGGLCKSSDLDSVHERLSPFVAAGFRALCALMAGRAVKSRRKKPVRKAADNKARFCLSPKYLRAFYPVPQWFETAWLRAKWTIASLAVSPARLRRGACSLAPCQSAHHGRDARGLQIGAGGR